MRWLIPNSPPIALAAALFTLASAADASSAAAWAEHDRAIVNGARTPVDFQMPRQPATPYCSMMKRA